MKPKGVVLLSVLALGAAAPIVIPRARQRLAGSAGPAPASRETPPAPAATRDEKVRDAVRAPAGVRVRVEVLNATTVNGLARRATRYLRDRGFDVVSTGTVKPLRDATAVYDRTGHPEWAGLVARSLGAGGAEARPDSSRYVDVTVLLGASWRPPAEPFHP